ncbi:hypothetical protein M5D96_012613 [Drosophila gunungcola]|uniref:Uncharacterized protein n=1 Tax=Drosophila gunungcola TaxID=103775 RepID=A0A9P9YD80_9MUSC|nr:hypothetical protein M5D96_012613 [Drosophila gunungcola]
MACLLPLRVTRRGQLTTGGGIRRCRNMLRGCPCRAFWIFISYLSLAPTATAPSTSTFGGRHFVGVADAGKAAFVRYNSWWSDEVQRLL